MQRYVAAAAGKTSQILEQDQRSWFLVFNKWRGRLPIGMHQSQTFLTKGQKVCSV